VSADEKAPRKWTTLALHGWQTEVPEDWDVVVNRGSWREGYVVLAHGRHGTCNLTWERRSRTPNLDKTLMGLDRRMRKESKNRNPLQMAHHDGLAGHGRWGCWVGPLGDLYGGIVHREDQGITFILRDVEPSDGHDLRRVALGCNAGKDGDPSRWTLHGIDVTLPPWWRLEGLQNLVGMVRGVWFRYPDGGTRSDGVCSIRRFAMAERLLNGDSVEQFLVDRMNPKDNLAERFTDGDGTTKVTVETPLPGWFNWLRGQRGPRIFWAWRDREWDRLTVQEWRGRRNPLECLRN
jgi:hypothetical protein